MIIVMSIITGTLYWFDYHDSDTYVPTGKVQSEATFAEGDIPAYYLKKYDVIDQRGNVYILEEK